MEVMQVIDPDLLGRAERRLWDEMFPGGFWAGSPHKAGAEVRLYGFAEACELLLCGAPEVVRDAIDPKLGPMLREYECNLREARAKQAAEGQPDRADTPVRQVPGIGADPNPTRARPFITGGES